jgi:hypothetical protein
MEPNKRQEKAAARLQEDAELEFRLQKLDLKVSGVDPVTKALVCTGSYADFLLARELAAKKGWNLTRNKGTTTPANGN